MEFEPQDLSPEAYRVLAHFAMLIPFETKTPLTRMYMWSELMLSGELGELTEKQKQGLIDIQLSSQKTIENVQLLCDVIKVALKLNYIHRMPSQIDEALAVLSDMQISYSLPDDLPTLLLDTYWFGNALKHCLRYDQPDSFVKKRALTASVEDDCVILDIQLELETTYSFNDMPDPDLFIATEIVKCHSGDLFVDDQEDKMLRVVIKLPILPSD
ncbi:MAG: hypothetical protein AAF629_01065 [Chloroflexota bacterium]